MITKLATVVTVVLGLGLVSQGPELSDSAIAKPNCCAKHAYCCKLKLDCCPKETAAFDAVTTAVETGPVDTAANSACCVKHAYCCVLKSRCCPESAQAEGAMGALPAAPAVSDLAAGLNCCAKHAYCCRLQRPCCRSAS